MRFLLIGPPASGKGTLGALLAERLNLPIVSVGELLRNVPPTANIYSKIHEYMDKGLLAPEEITAGILKEELSKEKYTRGFILDGWMRDMAQKNYFDPEIDFAIFINVSDETSIKRAKGRSSKGRVDDKGSVVLERIELFHNETVPVVEDYRAAGKLIEVNGEPSPKKVFELAMFALEEKGIINDTY